MPFDAEHGRFDDKHCIETIEVYVICPDGEQYSTKIDVDDERVENRISYGNNGASLESRPNDVSTSVEAAIRSFVDGENRITDDRDVNAFIELAESSSDGNTCHLYMYACASEPTSECSIRVQKRQQYNVLASVVHMKLRDAKKLVGDDMSLCSSEKTLSSLHGTVILVNYDSTNECYKSIERADIESVHAALRDVKIRPMHRPGFNDEEESHEELFTALLGPCADKYSLWRRNTRFEGVALDRSTYNRTILESTELREHYYHYGFSEATARGGHTINGVTIRRIERSADECDDASDSHSNSTRRQRERDTRRRVQRRRRQCEESAGARATVRGDEFEIFSQTVWSMTHSLNFRIIVDSRGSICELGVFNAFGHAFRPLSQQEYVNRYIVDILRSISSAGGADAYWDERRART